MSKLGQPIGLLDKLEGYSRIGFTCFVAKGSNWVVSVRGRRRTAPAFVSLCRQAPLRPLLPLTGGDSCSRGFPKAFWYILSPKAIKWFCHRARGKSLHCLITDYKSKDRIGINAQFAQLLVITGVWRICARVWVVQHTQMNRGSRLRVKHPSLLNQKLTVKCYKRISEWQGEKTADEIQR